LIDTQGADPGLEAEEQGIGNAIATTLSMMVEAPTPIVSVIIGEGGSEGALALGLSDRILMQQYAVYSPISLNHTLGVSYHDHRLDREAAEALMLTAQDCLELGIADQVVPEPAGGAHLNPKEATGTLQIALLKQLAELSKLSPNKLLKKRYQKFRRMGESSSYSQEAMTREVELLMKITGSASHRGRGGQSQRRSGSDDEVRETTVTADD
jgi:acetyl-CoA carboxylase alpha subunit